MQVSVESPSKIERRLTVVVPADKLEEAYNKRIIKLSKTAKINGFRPGKIPLDVVKQRFGDSVRQEAWGEVIESSLYSAMGQEHLSPVNTPKVEPKTMIPGQPLEFIATFEILPEIDQIVFNLPQLEKQVAKITEDDVTQVVEKLREQHATWKQVDRIAREKDQVVIDFEGSIETVPFDGGTAHDYAVILGNKTMIPGFEEGIMGMQSNEEKTIAATFPENYHAKDLAGKVAQFKIKLIKVMESELPELGDEFVKKLGIKSGSVDDFRAEIRKNIERELTHLIKQKLKMQVFDKLIEQNPIEIPKSLIEREAERIHHELHPHHKGHHHEHSDAEVAMFNESAKRNVTLGILIGEYIKQHKISPIKDRIDLEIDDIAAAYENPKNIKEWYANNKKAMAEVEMRVLEDQVIEKILTGTEVNEKMLSYNEFITGNRLK